MRKFNLILVLLIVFCAQHAVSETYIVKFKNEKSAKNFIQSNNIIFTSAFSINVNKLRNHIQVNSDFNPDLYYKLISNNSDLIHKLSKNPDIEFIEQNHKYKLNQIKYNDSLFNYQWSLDLVNARKSMVSQTGKGVRIAVVDSGIDYFHPDLKNQFMINPKEDLNGNGTLEPWDYREILNGLSGDLNGIDDDGNGYTDDVIGFDFVDLDFVHFGDWHNPDPIPDDEAGHGTNVASIIAAEGNNQIGMVGLANQSKILSVRAFDITGNGETDDIANAIIYAAVREVDIINMSFGDYFNSRLLEDAVNFAISRGCILVASSGNDDKAKPHYPSDFKDVICVGSVNKSGNRSSFSNWGSNLSLLAPGEEIATCESGGGYTLSYGTSFSAPFVTAAIALFLENNPKPTSAELRSHLEVTANKLSPNGWLFKSGAGILDVKNLLNLQGLSNIEINNIQNYSSFVNNKSLELSINAITPLFKNVQLEVAELNTQNFVTLSNKINKQLKNEKILVDLTNFKKDVEISIKLALNNGQIIRRQRAIRIINDLDSIKLIHKSALMAIKNGNRVVLISALTNIETSFSIEYYHKDYPNNKFRKIDLENSDKNHLIVIEDLILPGKYVVEGKLEPISVNSTKSNVSFILEFEFEQQIFPTQNVVQKDYNLPRAYLNNIVLDLYNKGTNQVIVNDLSNFVIENAKIYEFRNNTFNLLDTIKDWIPVAIGNSNGNELTDILMTYNGKTQITEAYSQGQSPFGKELYKSNFSMVEWGETMFDLDGDNIDEVIGYNDSSYFALKYNKLTNSYFVWTRTKLPEKLKNKGLTKSSVVTDIDGDGKPELIHSNYYGNILIYEFNKTSSQFNLEYYDTTNYGYSNPMLTLVKNADGIKEVIVATYGTEQLYGESSNINQIWSVRSIKSTGSNTYSINNIEHIMGVRAGIDPRIRVGFRNGIIGADIDNDSQDELIISTLPNTYVFKKISGQWLPYWHYPYSFTNSAIVWDFDKNGAKEIGIATFDSTKFFELPNFSKVIATPQFTDFYTLTNQMAVLKWTKSLGAHFYRVYKIIQNDKGEFILNQIAKTDFDSLVIIDLQPNTYHYFIVTAVDTSKGINESNYSEILTLYTNAPIYPIKVSLVNNITLVISFNGKLNPRLNIPDVFTIKQINGTYSEHPISAIANSDTSYILTLINPLERGEHEVICKSFRDFWNNPSLESSIYFESASPLVKDEIYLKSLEILDLNNLILEFSEVLDEQSSIQNTNYELKPKGQVQSVILDLSNPQKVQLQLNDEIKTSKSIGEIYSITAKNIKSLNNKPITTGAGNTLSFTLVMDNINSVFAFPNPVSISEDEYIGFGNLPKEFNITIMNLQGKILKQLSDNNAVGAIKWNLKDENGNKLSIGTYLYKIEGKNEQGKEFNSQINKFAVVP